MSKGLIAAGFVGLLFLIGLILFIYFRCTIFPKMWTCSPGKDAGQACSVPTDCADNLDGSGGNCCSNDKGNNVCVTTDKMVNIGGVKWCPGRKKGSKCDVPTDCADNMDGSGGNCCPNDKGQKVCTVGGNMVDIGGVKYCPGKSDGSKCVVPTDCKSNMDGSGGNCCGGICTNAKNMEGTKGSILWCPGDPAKGVLDGVLNVATLGISGIVQGNDACQAKYGSNSFWDSIDGGGCYSCPSTHAMQVFEHVKNSDRKCSLKKCPSSHPYMDIGAGICFKCPAPYSERTLDPVWTKTACGKPGEFWHWAVKKPANKLAMWKKAKYEGKGTEKEPYEKKILNMSDKEYFSLYE